MGGGARAGCASVRARARNTGARNRMYKEHCWPSEACQDGPGWRELQYGGAGTDSVFLTALPE